MMNMLCVRTLLISIQKSEATVKMLLLTYGSTSGYRSLYLPESPRKVIVENTPNTASSTVSQGPKSAFAAGV